LKKADCGLLNRQPMSLGSERLRHGALVYESQDEYLAHAVPFLREAIEAGDGAVVAHTKPGLAMMREALGPDAEQVTFLEASFSYTRPARTLAAYHALFVQQLDKTPAVRAIADVQFGPDPAEWDLWTAYECVTNRSFAHLPTWILCSYDANGTPDRIIERVWQTHPEVVSEAGWSTSDRYEEPDDLLRRLRPPPVTLPELRAIPFGRDVEEFRERLADELRAEQIGPAQSLDMLLAATEVAQNAIEHGGGVAQVRVGRADGRFVCEIVDRGPGFDDPAAGYLAPREGLGTGLWVARQLTWQLELFRSPDGFTARIWL
jgi:anti-sigma regulatory factor (Ser/Thr protein kinase)